MRRALVLSLALAATSAACTVDVEGAKCNVVGTVDNCPSGQACGTDKTCSEKAAGCAPCEVGAPAQCRDGDVKQCSAASDPVCGGWVMVTDCMVGLQTCKALAGVPTCACDRWTVELGVAEGICNKASISGAITEAAKFPGTQVLLGGAAPATYGDHVDDGAPIVIRSGVTLVGDDSSPAAAANQVIEARGSAAAALQVEAGASVRGVTVRRFDAGAPSVGVVVEGASPASGNSLAFVQIDAGTGGFPFATGLRIAGSNAMGANVVAVGNVLVRGATVAGLEVNRFAASDVVVVSGSTFDQNQVGVSLLKGDLTLAGSTVKQSTWEGVVAATGTPGQTSLALDTDVIAWNGRGGVRLSVNEALSVTATRICGNTGYLQSVVARTVGGIFALGNPPATVTFRGNLIHGNGGDQVTVAAASTEWNLSGISGCAVSDRNVFANYIAPGVGVAAVDATVSALFNYWSNAFPVANIDYTAVSGSVDAGTGTGNSFCLHTPPADLNCPAP